MSKKLVSFIFPVYNEEETIDELYKQIKLACGLLSNYSFELIFINDGSSDSTLEKLFKLHSQDSRINIINFSRNFGHQIAITAGIDFAQSDAIIIMDADLQDPPKIALELLKKWEEGYEIVYAQRRTRQDGIIKKFTASIFYRLIDRIANIKIPHDTGDFRLIDKKVAVEIRKFRETNRFMRGLFSYIGFKQTAVIYDRDQRYAGKTKYPFTKMIKLAVDGITGFSTFPLKIITQLGFLTSLLSILGIFYAVFMRIAYPEITVSGWTFMIISILFMGGMQMITLGILGSYIGRIYQEVQNRPLYLVSSIISSKNDKKN